MCFYTHTHTHTDSGVTSPALLTYVNSTINTCKILKNEYTPCVMPHTMPFDV